MKKWEDLTKAEKEKVDAYIKVTALWQETYTVLLVLCGVASFIGIPLIYTRFEPLILAGMFLLFVSAVIVLFALCFMQQDRKKLHYMFGIESLTKDVFDISNENLRKLKRVMIWKEEK